MNILFIGSWKEERVSQYDSQLKELAKILVKREHNLVTSPSAGVQGYLAKYYKEFGGKCFIGYYPNLFEMEKVGERVLIKPDVPILTNEDYPMRNLAQLRVSHGAININGGDGALCEALNLVNDYNQRLAILNDSSKFFEQIKENGILKKENILHSSNFEEMLDFIENGAQNILNQKYIDKLLHKIKLSHNK